MAAERDMVCEAQTCEAQTPVADLVDALLREKASYLLQAAIDAECEELLAWHGQLRDSAGRKAVVRNGYLPVRSVLTGLGPISIKVPRVKDRSAQGIRFESRLVPHYMRQVSEGDAALRGFCLNRLARGDLAPVLAALVGTRNLPANVSTRLKLVWNQNYGAWDTRDLSKENWICIWADSISFSGEPDGNEHRMLVTIGHSDRHQKQLLAISERTEPSMEAWHDMLISLKRRGLVATEAVAGDRAAGFGDAFAQVFPGSRYQHRINGG